ncbi:MAG: ABC transporter ATP-binding protein [Halobacteriota archaeon]
MIYTKNLSAGYGEVHVLFDIDSQIEKKKITAIVGPNGSGKSTLLKSLFGLTSIYSGRVFYKDEDITRMPAHERTKMGIAYLPQVDNIFTNLTVKENLTIAGYTLPEDEFEERKEVSLNTFPELKDFMDRKAGTLSGGERQFLATATALIRKAELVMMDEPSAALSPKFAEMMFDKVVELRDEFKLTIALVEQNIEKALAISENAYLLVSGRIAFEGKSGELLEHEKFEKLCMGILQ